MDYLGKLSCIFLWKGRHLRLPRPQRSRVVRRDDLRGALGGGGGGTDLRELEAGGCTPHGRAPSFP